MVSTAKELKPGQTLPFLKMIISEKGVEIKEMPKNINKDFHGGFYPIEVIRWGVWLKVWYYNLQVLLAITMRNTDSIKSCAVIRLIFAPICLSFAIFCFYLFEILCCLSFAIFVSLLCCYSFVILCALIAQPCSKRRLSRLSLWLEQLYLLLNWKIKYLLVDSYAEKH